MKSSNIQFPNHPGSLLSGKIDLPEDETPAAWALFAGNKRWPLESVMVRLAHNKIHAEDCAGGETQKGKLTSSNGN